MKIEEFEPIKLTMELINCPSVTPIDAGAIDLVAGYLKQLGFNCQQIKFGEVNNLYARFGTAEPNFCFAGHTDVVPPGDLSLWESDPFKAEIRDKRLYGRGSSDMKAAIACYLSATANFLQHNGGKFPGSISFLITADEEGPSVDGTVKVLQWLKEQNEQLHACVIGEPTSPGKVGEMAKIGRRGSLCLDLTVNGLQGHVAYPHLSDNPITPLAKIIAALKEQPLDHGDEYFQPSNLEVVSINVPNQAFNVIPANAQARINIRYNTLQTAEKLIAWIDKICSSITSNYQLEVATNATSYLSQKSTLTAIVEEAVLEVVGIKTEISTTGGTSDARFIKDFCPVIDIGLCNQTAHKVNENVEVEDIYLLAGIYDLILKKYFSNK